jgi:hypothetical protein
MAAVLRAMTSARSIGLGRRFETRAQESVGRIKGRRCRGAISLSFAVDRHIQGFLVRPFLCGIFPVGFSLISWVSSKLALLADSHSFPCT